MLKNCNFSLGRLLYRLLCLTLKEYPISKPGNRKLLTGSCFSLKVHSVINLYSGSVLSPSRKAQTHKKPSSQTEAQFWNSLNHQFLQVEKKYTFLPIKKLYR